MRPQQYGGRPQGGDRGNFGGGGGRPVEIEAISSPYNFVPLSPHVVFPAWAPKIRHDVPFHDGLSGALEVEIEALSPLIIRGASDNGGQSSDFATDAAGNPQIPGTSLKGMLRNALEIATFGKLGRVNEHVYGLRDLQNRHLYGQFMAEIQDRNPTPLVNAGWLHREQTDDGERWTIQPCHFAAIEYGILEDLARQLKIPNFRPNDRQSSVDKYKAWGEAHRKTPIECTVELRARAGQRAQSGAVRISDFGKVAARGQRVRGRLVFTGQPQNRRPGEKRKKHHDFIFYGETGQRIAISDKIRRDFEFVHRDSGQQDRDEQKPNAEWGFWRGKDEPAPVFFLTWPDGRLRALGLAMMFRLAYDHSTLEVVAHAQPQHQDPKLDFAEALFGYVESELPQDKRQARLEMGYGRALRGRINVGVGRLQGPARYAPKVRAVLNGPKASFYPNYIEQGTGDSGPGAAPPRVRTGAGFAWRSYMQEDKPPQARGWKRYIARGAWETTPHIPAAASDRVVTHFTPLKEGSRFKAMVRFHNLRPMELGALLWILNLGGEQQAQHALGQARSLGYGAVKLKGTLIDCVPNKPGAEPPNAQGLVEAFEGYMESAVPGGWRASRQIFELRALMTPGAGRDERWARHMRIDHPAYGNEFVAAKKQGLVLPSHGGEAGYKVYQRQVKPVAPRPDAFTASPIPHTASPTMLSPTTPPTMPTPARLGAGTYRARFAEWNHAKDIRRRWAKAQKSGKAYVKELKVELLDHPGMFLNVKTDTAGFEALWRAIADSNNQPIEFQVTLDQALTPIQVA
ncbi:TIGR03986 family CRISPR-associated RAMP protein [Myxococcota bacterium]|nr:TIGR03986 family CRISPR-associated RAMP protein [Myxococcota bacterium]